MTKDIADCRLPIADFKQRKSYRQFSVELGAMEMMGNLQLAMTCCN